MPLHTTAHKPHVLQVPPLANLRLNVWLCIVVLFLKPLKLGLLGVGDIQSFRLQPSFNQVDYLTAHGARLAIGKRFNYLEQFDWHTNGYKVVFRFLFHVFYSPVW
jgi:hypothetical protein